MVVFRVDVDGAFHRFAWDWSPYGWKGSKLWINLEAVCADPLNLPGYLARGKYKVTVQAHIAGREADPTPVEATIELTCAGFDPRTCPTSPEYVRSDAGAPAPDAGAKGGGSGGCSVVGGAPAAGVPLLLLAVAAGLRAGRAGRPGRRPRT
jgi:hypothetical protein